MSCCLSLSVYLCLCGNVMSLLETDGGAAWKAGRRSVRSDYPEQVFRNRHGWLASRSRPSCLVQCFLHSSRACFSNLEAVRAASPDFAISAVAAVLVERLALDPDSSESSTGDDDLLPLDDCSMTCGMATSSCSSCSAKNIPELCPATCTLAAASVHVWAEWPPASAGKPALRRHLPHARTF